MILCKRKYKNSSGKYVRYYLVDTETKQKKIVSEKELKIMLDNNPYCIANLTLTNDGKIKNDPKKAPEVAMAIPFSERKLNQKMLNLAKKAAYVQYQMGSYDNQDSTYEWIELKTGKEVTSDKVYKELLIEAFYYVLENGEYRDFGDFVGYNFSDPYWAKDGYGGDIKIRQAVNSFIQFGTGRFSNEVLYNLAEFLKKEED